MSTRPYADPSPVDSPLLKGVRSMMRTESPRLKLDSVMGADSPRAASVVTDGDGTPIKIWGNTAFVEGGGMGDPKPASSRPGWASNNDVSGEDQRKPLPVHRAGQSSEDGAEALPESASVASGHVRSRLGAEEATAGHRDETPSTVRYPPAAALDADGENSPSITAQRLASNKGVASVAQPQQLLQARQGWESSAAGMAASGRILEAVQRTAPSGVGLIRCTIKRTKHAFSAVTYELSLDNGSVPLLAARKAKLATGGHVFAIGAASRDSSRLKDPDLCLAKLKANFVGSEYVLLSSPFAQEEVVVSFKANTELAGGPRTMTAMVPLVPMSSDGAGSMGGGEAAAAAAAAAAAGAAAGEASGLSEMMAAAKKKQLSPAAERKVALLCTKPPEYDEAKKTYSLDFKGRSGSLLTSTKNMQLVCWDHVRDQVGSEALVQFAKTGKDQFCLDFAYPMSALTAFGIALASLDDKLLYTLG